MTEKNINARVIHKHDIEANWAKAEKFIPKKAEIIVYDPDENYEYPRFKIGDGVTLVNELPFTVEKIVEEILKIIDASHKPRPDSLTLTGGDAWEYVSNKIYRQDITSQLDGKITEYSKIDLQPTPQQLSIFYEKDVAFTIVNDDGTVYIYAVGTRPEQDYEDIQITIMEVSIDA